MARVRAAARTRVGLRSGGRRASVNILAGCVPSRSANWRCQMNVGPDLGAVFDEHVASEFEAKDIDATMRTMVEEPYVWHVPGLTGASGGDAVRRFYSSQFIGHTPADTVVLPISRTVSANRVIDE